MKSIKVYKSAAVLTVKDADKMTKSGRRQIAKWLLQQAKYLVQFGDQYGPTLRARYLYPDK